VNGPAQGPPESEAASPRSPSPTGRLRRWTGPALVLAAMVAAFAIGVLVASRTELFPPQVQGADGAPARSPTASPSSSDRWRGRMATATRQYYSAGPCTTDWSSVFDVAVDPDGAVRGAGRARLRGGPRCPFPTSQPQISGYAFHVAGRFDPASGFRLSLSRFDATSGIFDYGGFAPTMADARSILEVAVDGDRGRGRIRLRTRTSLGKTVRSVSRVSMDCRTCPSS
jgi:hypothetical protein